MTASPSLDATVQRVGPRRRTRRHLATVPRSAFGQRAARRAANREGRAFLDELRCECARPDCHASFPARADVYRRRPEQFIVVPGHFAGESVIAAADHFFVVES